jgi:formyl-CoA transferase
VLGDATLGSDPRYATNIARCENRTETDAQVASAFARFDVEPLMAMLQAADIAFGRVSDPGLLAQHPHLRRISVGTPSGPASTPAPSAQHAGEMRRYGPVPALGEHTAKVKAEFLLAR